MCKSKSMVSLSINSVIWAVYSMLCSASGYLILQAPTKGDANTRPRERRDAGMPTGQLTQSSLKERMYLTGEMQQVQAPGDLQWLAGKVPRSARLTQLRVDERQGGQVQVFHVVAMCNGILEVNCSCFQVAHGGLPQ
ncbi:hypothetical protein F5887DRAFT_60827 [Amanita rubescens]|nr:hypothetical protein F5887DRAFT_60827 [Amanita rubescens]